MSDLVPTEDIEQIVGVPPERGTENVRFTHFPIEPDGECTCAMTESSLVSCSVHGYTAPEIWGST